ncbi:MAG: sugar phosphate isomerase/epimerase [Nocardiopsaceae bacterium]|nr:sugar phosphate isomerase/epimerase [Nocardiopsaceae bacterium]
MRLAVSTLGLPGQGLGEAIEIAAAHGCEGLELRLHPDTGIYLDMPEAERATARNLITARGMEILALAGYARVAVPGPDAPVVEELAAGLRLAESLGAPALRVFPGGTDVVAAARRIRAALRDGPGSARILVETHDEMPTGADVARLLDAVGLPARAGAIWDVLHPWRHGEQPRDTLAALGDRLGYVQVKDAAADRTPVPLGTGTVPLREIGALLRASGYDGWASLEWERTWYPHVAPVEEVLPAARSWTGEFSRSRSE